MREKLKTPLPLLYEIVMASDNALCLHGIYDLFKGPVKSFAVLRHLKSRGSYAPCIGRLAGQEEHAVGLEEIGCFCSRRHIGAFRHGHDAVCHQSLGIL